MREGRIQAVITGADRIAANGDTANKIGTYSVALLATAHAIPFYVAAPSSTFDLSCGRRLGHPDRGTPARRGHSSLRSARLPRADRARNPAFDVTPAELITCLITERGLIQPVTREAIRSRDRQGQGTLAEPGRHMNFALVGDDPDILPLISALAASQTHRLECAALIGGLESSAPPNHPRRPHPLPMGCDPDGGTARCRAGLRGRRALRSRLRDSWLRRGIGCSSCREAHRVRPGFTSCR